MFDYYNTLHLRWVGHHKVLKFTDIISNPILDVVGCVDRVVVVKQPYVAVIEVLRNVWQHTLVQEVGVDLFSETVVDNEHVS